MRRSLPYIALTVAYVVTGMLGLLLAVPPGYATAMFPPAGIAVGAMLIGGAATLPWTFLGSFLLNIWVSLSPSDPFDIVRLSGAASIAVASMLQATIGGTILRRVVGYPTPLDSTRKLAMFVALPPLFCVTSASLSLAMLSALRVVRDRDLATSWLTWWIGDTLGVLFVLPLMLVAIGKPRALWRSRARTVALPMLVFFAVFVAIFIRVSSWEHEQSLLEFRLLSQGVVDRIRSQFDEQETFLDQLGRSFVRVSAVTREDFNRLVQHVPQRFPVLQAVEWAPRVEAADRRRFEAEQQRALPGFVIRERDPQGGLRPAGERARYYPVTYLEPQPGNEEAIGFDLASDPDRNAAIAAAITDGGISATAPIRLLQDHEQGRSILLMYPMQGGATGPGIVLSVLKMNVFMRTLLHGAETNLNAAFYDVDSGQALFASAPISPRDAGFQKEFTFGSRHYILRTSPSAAYWEAHPAWQSWAVLVIGVFSTGLLGTLLMLATGQAHRSEQIVEERTHDLQTSNERLKVEIDEREHAQAALRQAQRMEAIGKLTGGIAHDFNNLLMVVSSNAELLRRFPLDSLALARVAAILQATERGERLTRQLLAFSRRQSLRPEILDLHNVIQEVADMLTRSLRANISLSLKLADDLRPVAADRAELELAMLNIAVNARDAMPNGGTLRLTAHNVVLRANDPDSPGLEGAFVALVFSDNGVGMAPEVVAQAFEPFFTTKEVGQGSGLGLSQVYGFAQQSGGTATIASTPGRGTSVTMFLPVAPGRIVAVRSPESADALGVDATPVCVLLVEDNEDVAAATASMLRELGCHTIEARDGASALEILEREPAIELVMSDIVMPGAMNGLDLARFLRERRPDLSVVLATAYSQYGREVASEGFPMLEKPYRLDRLARVIETAIAAKRQHHRAL